MCIRATQGFQACTLRINHQYRPASHHNHETYAHRRQRQQIQGCTRTRRSHKLRCRCSCWRTLQHRGQTIRSCVSSMAHRQGQALSQPRTRWVWSWSWGTESRTTGEEASAAQLHQAHVTVTSHAYRGIPAAHVNVEADVKVPDATVHTLFMPHASAHAAARHTISQTLTHTSDQQTVARGLRGAASASTVTHMHTSHMLQHTSCRDQTTCQQGTPATQRSRWGCPQESCTHPSPIAQSQQHRTHT